MLASGEPTLPFCICWANENWTRRWDGKESEILIGQEHTPETDRRFITDLLPTLGDDRYITVDGKRLLLIYRPTLLHNCRRATDTWRDESLKAGLGELHLVAVQHGDHDPIAMGFDATAEFPPHNFQAPDIRNEVENLDPDFNGGVYDYEALVDLAIERPRPPYPMHRGVMLAWDNTARRGLDATVYHRADPAAYRRWLEAMLRDAQQHGERDEVVFINAWNEWAEGTHMEPDDRHGHGWLEATRAALESVGGSPGSSVNTMPIVVATDGDPSPSHVRRMARQRKWARSRHRLKTMRVRAGNFMRRPGKIRKLATRCGAAVEAVLKRLRVKRPRSAATATPTWRASAGALRSGHPVLFVGHDAHLAGSQMLMREMLRLANASGTINPMVLLLGEGVLENDYRRMATTCSVASMLDEGVPVEDAIAAAIAAAPQRPEVALCSTIACASAARVCRGLDIPVVHLINELPTTVESNGWEDLVLDIGASARRMIFVSRFSREAFIDRFDLDESRCEIVYPGWLENGQISSDRDRHRRSIRRELSIRDEALIVLGCGQIHPRKGVDLFVQVAARVLAQPGTEDVHFAWVGDGTAHDTRWITHDIAALPCRDRIHLVQSRSDVHPWFEAADLYVLSSREDPYPIVCVQAMASGLPVVAFDGSGGAPEALSEGGGQAVPFLDTAAMADAVVALIRDGSARQAMGEAGQDRATKACTSRHHFEGVLDVVASTCGVDLRH